MKNEYILKNGHLLLAEEDTTSEVPTDTDNSSSVLLDSEAGEDDSQDSSVSLDTSGAVSLVEVPDDRPFLSTPLDDYNVTEGLLLVVVIIAVLSLIIAVFKGR